MSEFKYPSFAEAIEAYKKRPQGDERIRLFEKYNKKLDLIWLEMIECENLPKHKSLKILKGYGLNE